MVRERIIWEGRPKYKARWAFLEIFGGGAEVGPYTGVLPLAFFMLILGLIKWSGEGYYFRMGLLWILLFLMLFGAEFHKSIRRKKTKYVLTNKQLIIFDYWYGKKKKYIIELSDITKFYLVNYKDNCGEIHIYKKSEKTFNTRNFWSGSIRPTIALEDIENASHTFKIFNQNLDQYRKSISK